MKNVIFTGAALFGIGALLALFTSRESSRRLDHKPWYIAVELTTLALLAVGFVLMLVGALAVAIFGAE